jgi:hypothetical protein
MYSSQIIYSCYVNAADTAIAFPCRQPAATQLQPSQQNNLLGIFNYTKIIGATTHHLQGY